MEVRVPPFSDMRWACRMVSCMTRLLTASWRDSSNRTPGSHLSPFRTRSSGSGKVMAFLPMVQSVSPETPKFWGSRSDLEPVVTNEEEIIRALLKPFGEPTIHMAHLPDKPISEYVPQYFGRYAGGDVQQRVSGAFELDYVPFALFNLFLQDSYRVDVGLATHTGFRSASAPRNAPGTIHLHRPQCLRLLILGHWWIALAGNWRNQHNRVEGGMRSKPSYRGGAAASFADVCVLKALPLRF